MIIDLPDKKTFCQGRNKVALKGGNLEISFLESWRSLAYSIAIANQGKCCHYCGRKLKNEEITMDHLYPQDLGGPAIPNNLAPSCSRCNSQKGNLTEHQFLQMLKAPQGKKRAIKQKFLAINQERKANNGFYLPKRWITTKKIDTVLVTFYIGRDYKGKRYARIGQFYKKYGLLPYPIIVDKNNCLLDGFLILMYAKNNGITNVPTIKLSNVEMVF